MGGGLMQLVAYGAQDIYLTGNPQITFFKVVYRRHTNFSIESIQQTISGSSILSEGNSGSVTISRNGDLVSGVYLRHSGGDALADFWRHAIRSVDLEIGGQLIDRHNREYLEIFNELTIPASKANAFKSMIGQVGDKDLGGVYNVYIPLRFWFCNNPGLALPLIALQYHEVILKFLWGAVSHGDNILNVEVWCDYIYLDTDERRRFAQVSHEYLIEQVQIQHENQKRSTFELNFNHPVKELLWTTPPNFFLNENVLKLQLNGHDRFSDQYPEYFQLKQPMDYHTSVPHQNLPWHGRNNANESPAMSRIIHFAEDESGDAKKSLKTYRTHAKVLVEDVNKYKKAKNEIGVALDVFGIHKSHPEILDHDSNPSHTNIGFNLSEDVSNPGTFVLNVASVLGLLSLPQYMMMISIKDTAIGTINSYLGHVKKVIQDPANAATGKLFQYILHYFNKDIPNSGPNNICCISAFHPSKHGTWNLVNSDVPLDHNPSISASSTGFKLSNTDDGLTTLEVCASSTNFNEENIQGGDKLILTIITRGGGTTAKTLYGCVNSVVVNSSSYDDDTINTYLTITLSSVCGGELTDSNQNDTFTGTVLKGRNDEGRTSTMKRKINCYSFALKPEEHQPSGTCNFSRIDNAQFICSTTVINTIYAVNYNVLRIMSGMGGLAYSN
jgi:hypothetical protein